ncbi:hypothetical protein CPC08DRAFT_433069 [Agrocybe pediades]|nr:hypothetical protein CPC08DRAFT_433069 [Agrocybe pediades]
MYDQKSIGLALTCWLYSKPGEGNCIMQLYLIARLFVQGQDDGSILPDNYFAVSFQSFDIGIFVSRLNLILQCKTMDARHLRAEIVAITPFIHDRSYRTHIVESRVHVELVASVKRILIKSAKQKTNKRFQAQEDDAQEADAETGMSDAIISSLLHCCGHFLWKLLELSRDGDGGDLLLDLIRNTAMMEICAAAMQLLNRRSCMAAIETPWHCILIMVGYLLHPSHRSRFPLPDSMPHFFYHGLAQAVKTVIERIAMPVLVSLTSEGGAQCSDVSHSDYSDAWKGLLDHVGVSEESVRGSYKEQKKCCNIKCPSRKFETCLLVMPKKSICAGCHSAFYCDRECQIMDWQYHKEECKKMRTASAVVMA